MSESKSSVSEVKYVSEQSPVVLLQYEDLTSGKDLSASIAAAYGPDGLGILVVHGVPQMTEARAALLPQARKFADLPDNIKAKYEHKPSHYNFGWSHGKENLDGQPDYAKGSFYNNPLYDRPYDDEEVIKQYPTFAHPNIWPKEDLPALEPAFKGMGAVIQSTGLLVAALCDKFVKAQCPSYEDNKLHNIIKNSRNPKARLLHYFPIDEKKAAERTGEADFASWCGWHNDHGSLTGLVPAMYFDAEGKEVPCPDPQAGLYIRSRKGVVVKASFPADCLAFQMGEAGQIHSGGVLQATPHCVRGASVSGVSRETYAMFMEPKWDEAMVVPKDVDPAKAAEATLTKYLPKGIPALPVRWNPDMDFGTFSEATFSAYDVDVQAQKQQEQQ